MPIRNTAQRWGVVAKGFHWSVAVAVLVMIGTGLWAEDLPYGKLKVDVFWFHKSLGILILATMCLRLAWRLINPAPPLPQGLKPWERWAAHLTHYGFYVVLLAMPISGWVVNSAANFPLTVFGWFEVPAIAPPSESIKDTAADVHGVLYKVILALLALHVGAALKHHFVLGDDVLRRMLPFGRLRTEDRQ